MPSTNGHGPKRAILYARVSTDEQARTGFSLRQQIERLREYAAQEGYEVLEEVTDPGQSGASLERPGMDRVRDLVAAAGVSVVLAQDRDRFSREPAYTYLLRRELAEHGTELRSLNDRGDGSPEGELTDGILDQLAKYERAKIRERSRRGRLRKAKEGHLLRTGRAHYGYRYTDSGDAYVVYEPEMQVVHRIFRAVVGGLTLYGIKRALETDGVPPPKNGDKGGTYWCTSFIRTLIQDDVYMPHTRAEIDALVRTWVAARLDDGPHGIFWFNRTRTTRRRISVAGPDGREYKWKYKVHKNPRELWVAIPVVDAGLEREIVEAAREMIRDNKPPGKTGRRLWQIPAASARCGDCGTVMLQYATLVGGRIYAYYKCARLVRFGKDGCCPDRKRTNHRADQIEEQVWQFVSKIMQDPEQLQQDLERMIEMETGPHGDPEREERAWLAKIAELDGLRRGYQHQAAAGYMTLDELGVALDELQKECRDAEGELRATRGRKQAIEQLEADKESVLAHYARIAPEALESLTPEERHRLYKMLRVQVLVHPDTTLEVSGVFGDSPIFSDEEFVPR